MLILFLIASVCLTLVVATLFLLRPATESFAPSPSFDEGLQVQRVLAAVEESANNRSTITMVTDKSSATDGA